MTRRKNIYIPLYDPSGTNLVTGISVKPVKGSYILRLDSVPPIWQDEAVGIFAREALQRGLVISAKGNRIIARRKD